MPDSKTAPVGEPDFPDEKILFDIARMKMPFGRYEGCRLIDLPEPYVVWWKKEGFPRGRLGMLLASLYEIKANGLEPLFDSLREPSDPRYRAQPDMPVRGPDVAPGDRPRDARVRRRRGPDAPAERRGREDPVTRGPSESRGR